jgi:AcrR family transcriptional regulator
MNPAQRSPADRMVRAAAGLLHRGGIDAVSTRAVAAAADVQPPAIYRQFGDKDGLLDAAARYVMERYMIQKRVLATGTDDPMSALRTMWDLHVEFGLNEPACYVLVFGQARTGRVFAATAEAVALLTSVIARLGEQGRLKMSVERATSYFRSTGTGFILTQIGTPASERDPELSSIIFDDSVAAITNQAKPRPRATTSLPGRAIALREALRDQPNAPLTSAERDLLAEWLNRLADNQRQAVTGSSSATADT